MREIFRIRYTVPAKFDCPPEISIGVLARQRKRQVDSTKTFPEIGFMKGPGAGKLDLERLDEAVRQHRRAVREAFPFLDNNCAPHSV